MTEKLMRGSLKLCYDTTNTCVVTYMYGMQGSLVAILNRASHYKTGLSIGMEFYVLLLLCLLLSIVTLVHHLWVRSSKHLQWAQRTVPLGNV